MSESMNARVREYEEKLSTEMPKDMKDWWENSKEEWPEIARWVLENRRKRMEQAERERDKLAEGYERRRVELDAQYSEIKKLQADLDALRATSAELDADRLRKHEELHRVKADLEKAKRERDEARALLSRQQDITIDARKELDAALLVCEVLGVEYGRAWLSEDARRAGEHVLALLEKRRVERG